MSGEGGGGSDGQTFLLHTVHFSEKSTVERWSSSHATDAATCSRRARSTRTFTSARSDAMPSPASIAALVSTVVRSIYF